MDIRRKLMRLELEEIRKYREVAEQLISEKMYGLKSTSLSGDLRVMTFSGDLPSHIVIKDTIPSGLYEIMIRPPEISSMKLDLNKPGTMRGTKQIRVFFTRRDWKKLTGF